MREKDYLARLTRTARWRLPTKEADDIIEDYTELLMIDFRPYEDLCRDYGTPKYAVRQLSFFRDYGRWLLTFWVLAAFLALPALGLFVPMPTISFLYGWQEALLLFLSLVLSIAWFRLEGVRFRERPDQLPLLMVVLILTGLSTAMLAQALFREVPLEGFFSNLPLEQVGFVYTTLLRVIGGCCALLALIGLVNARLGDRRWLALFTAGLTVVFLTAILYRIVTNMSIPDPPAVWFTTEVWQLGITAARGVIGTGVALC